jgi:hypothetical protein
MKKYEYLKGTKVNFSQGELNGLGEKGWKLLAVVPSNSSSSCDYFFIKEIEELASEEEVRCTLEDVVEYFKKQNISL